MAVPFMFGPGGQPILMGQIPIMPQQFPQQQQQQQQQQQPVVTQSQQATIKEPPFIREEQLQEKGNILSVSKLQLYY